MQKIAIIRPPAPDFPFVALCKPAGLPSAPLCTGDSECALTQATAMLPELRRVHGRNPLEYGLLHRLDTDTRGLLLLAATQEAYQFLLEAQQEGRFVKTYRAHCCIAPDNAMQLGGFPPPEPNALLQKKYAEIRSYFRSYGTGGKSVRPVTEQSGRAAVKKCGAKKSYATAVTLLTLTAATATVECTLTQGYRHQVRCHLAWYGLPIAGDRRYNAAPPESASMQFTAVALAFPNPITGRTERIALPAT